MTEYNGGPAVAHVGLHDPKDTSSMVESFKRGQKFKCDKYQIIRRAAFILNERAALNPDDDFIA